MCKVIGREVVISSKGAEYLLFKCPCILSNAKCMGQLAMGGLRLDQLIPKISDLDLLMEIIGGNYNPLAADFWPLLHTMM